MYATRMSTGAGGCFSCGSPEPGYLVSGCEDMHLSHFLVCDDCMPAHMYPCCLTQGCDAPAAGWIWLSEDGRKVTSWC